MAVANSVWYRPSYPILAPLWERVRTYYDAEIEPITTTSAINSWAKKATRGRIEEIVAGEIPANVVAYLINALYFKANWTKPYDERSTRSAHFRRPDGSTVPVRMMSQEGSFEVRSGDGMQLLRLPYGAGRFGMILALPEEGTPLRDIAVALDRERWRSWMSEFTAVPRLVVEVPRFEVEWNPSRPRRQPTKPRRVPVEPEAAPSRPQ